MEILTGTEFIIVEQQTTTIQLHRSTLSIVLDFLKKISKWCINILLILCLFGILFILYQAYYSKIDIKLPIMQTDQTIRFGNFSAKTNSTIQIVGHTNFSTTTMSSKDTRENWNPI